MGTPEDMILKYYILPIICHSEQNPAFQNWKSCIVDVKTWCPLIT